MSNSDLTIKFSNFDAAHVARLNFTDFEENQRSKGQKISYPRYSSESGAEIPLFIQFPWITLETYGVPKLGEYYPDDSKRAFVKLPLDESVEETKQLIDLVKMIDEKLSSDEFKQKMFGAKASKYNYEPIFRLPQEEDETKKVEKKYNTVKHPYMKLKIDTTFPDNQVKTIVFNSVLKDGRRTRSKIDDIRTVTDFANYVCWMSSIRPIVRPVKLWAQPATKKDPTYGLTFKIAKTEVTPPVKSNNSNVKRYMESDNFLDSDEESDVAESKTEAPSEAPSAAPSDAASASTIKGKQIAQVESDDSDESSEDTKPVAPSKQAKKPAKKQAVSSSDSESDSDDVKPVVKSVQKPKKKN